jgi:hypothetical protein
LSNKTIAITGWIAIALFLAGIIQLMLLRFSAGDVYPYYSSYRADPLGAKAFYESLELCCEFQVVRNHEPFSRIKDDFDSTVLVAGLSHRSLAAVPRAISEEINYFISGGGRLVITLHTPRLQEDLLRLDPNDSTDVLDLTDVWGIRFFSEKRVTGNAYLDPAYHATGLPRSISAHTPLYFQTVHPNWKTVYERNQHPVFIERKLGRGSLVISAESYFLSNEALAGERYASLLSWMIGNPGKVIFDEYHHGIAESAGVMYLARKYDLEWLLLIFLLLALLFVWKSAVPFVPPLRETAESLQSGKESIAGLTNLLRRNVPEPQLLSVCYAEWRKSAKNITEERSKAMEQLLANEKAKPARQRNLAALYNALSRVLKERM